MITRKQIVEKAREYLGTPWVHRGREKGVAVDCAGLIICVAYELGILPDLNTPGYVNYPRRPEGNRLLLAVEGATKRVHIDKMQPGDIVLFRISDDPQHLGFVGDKGSPLSLIHAYIRGPRRVVEHVFDEDWKTLIMGVYQFSGVI